MKGAWVLVVYPFEQDMLYIFIFFGAIVSVTDGKETIYVLNEKGKLHFIIYQEMDWPTCWNTSSVTGDNCVTIHHEKANQWNY